MYIAYVYGQFIHIILVLLTTYIQRTKPTSNGGVNWMFMLCEENVRNLCRISIHVHTCYILIM
jgi:hypothetical protein